MKIIPNVHHLSDSGQRHSLVKIVLVILLVLVMESSMLSFPQPATVSPEPLVSSTRTAYLISVNETSNRTLHAIAILKKVGFKKIQIETPLHMGNTKKDKTKSNKDVQMKIYKKIVSNSEPWGYIFEDDINLCRSQSHLGMDNSSVPFSVVDDLVCNAQNKRTCLEMLHDSFLYLGICLPHEMHLIQSITETETLRLCGRCAHAYGISQAGARELLEFEKTFSQRGKRHYMDAIIDQWCRQNGGFPVSDAKCQRVGDFHFGTFMQDRDRFASLIGA